MKNIPASTSLFIQTKIDFIMNMKKLLASVLGALCLSLTVSASAETVTAQDVKTRVMTNMQVVPERVNATEIPGVWEVYIDESMFYIDSTGRYLITGRLFDVKTKEDLTARNHHEIWRTKWKEWPFHDAVKQVFGKGERELVVFSDANCSFCRMMEKRYEEVGNLTVYTFIMPMLRGEENAREIVCSKDPATAWSKWMRDHIRPQESISSNCDTSVLQRNKMLAARYGINSAPTFFFRSGERMKGAMTAAQLNTMLQSAQ